MKAVKSLVIFLGVLLFAGLGVLGWGLSTKTHLKNAPPSSGTAAVTEFGSIPVPVPAGARVEQMVVSGDRIVLRLTGAGAERLIVLDPAQGRVAGSFQLSPEPTVR